MTKTIGFLLSRKQGENAPEITAFLSTLDSLGFSEAKKTIKKPILKHADDDPDKKKNNAGELIKAGVDLIIAAGGSENVYVAKKATEDAQSNPARRLPVVFTTFSESISPAPNMTGVYAHTIDADEERMKRLYDRIKGTWPHQQYGVLENDKRSGYVARRFDSWADDEGLPYPDYKAAWKGAGESENTAIKRITDAFDAWRKKGIRAALVTADPLFNHHRNKVIKAANGTGSDYHITTMYQWHDFVDDGGDMSYGTPIAEAYIQAAIIAAQVLGGTNPSAIPVHELKNLRMKP